MLRIVTLFVLGLAIFTAAPSTFAGECCKGKAPGTCCPKDGDSQTTGSQKK